MFYEFSRYCLNKVWQYYINVQLCKLLLYRYWVYFYSGWNNIIVTTPRIITFWGAALHFNTCQEALQLIPAEINFRVKTCQVMIFSDIWGPPKVLALARSISYTCTEHCLNGEFTANLSNSCHKSDSVFLFCAFKFSVIPAVCIQISCNSYTLCGQAATGTDNPLFQQNLLNNCFKGTCW